MASARRCECCGYHATPDGPGLADKLMALGSWLALGVGAVGAVMLGPHFTLFVLPMFVPPFMGLMVFTHARAMRTPECRACGRYMPEPDE